MNSIIKDTPVQTDLNAFKCKIGCIGENLGVVGHGYWREFIERNNNKMTGKKGKK